MIKLKTILNGGIRETSILDFIRNLIKGTEWENRVYQVGGSVRDELLGVDDIKDIDLMVDYPDGGIKFANWITQKTNSHPPVTFPRFGTAKFNLNGVIHRGIDLSGIDIESVMPRAEKYAVGSRKPDVSQSDLKGDAERRDLTFNALFKNLSTGQITDLTGKGKEDLEKGIIRTPLDPDKTFSDDALRMLRVCRFYAKYGYEIPMYILKSLKKNASQLQNISSERIQEELNKMLITTRPDKAIKLLKVTGLLQYVIPELIPAIKMVQNKHHSEDVFSHTLTVLSKTQPVLIQRLTGLFHDIGKTVTKSVTPTGVHFYGHEMEGAKIAREVMARLKYPTELIEAVVLGVRNHMRLKSAKDTGVELSDKSLRKFKIDMGDQLENILSLIHADNTSHADASAMPNQIGNIKKRLDTLNLNVVRGKPKLPITGEDLKVMGLKPGPIFSEIMKAVTDAWYENPNLNKEQALEIAKQVSANV